MTQKRYTEIPKRQKCINKEEPYIGGAKDIIDDELNKPQSQVNNEVLTEIGADNVPNSIKGRVKGLEDQVGEGGTVDERIAAAVAPKANSSDVYAKTETYSKTELNNMITTPSQEYVTVTATDQTTAATDVLPATGEADTVYRVGNWDGSQYDTTCYTEYAWNGSVYVSLNTKEYGIDDEPTVGSDNLVKSGGVCDQLTNISEDVYYIKGVKNNVTFFADTFLYSTGITATLSGYSTSDFINVKNMDSVDIYGNFSYNYPVCFYDKDKKPIPNSAIVVTSPTNKLSFTVPDIDGIVYFRYMQGSNPNSYFIVTDSNKLNLYEEIVNLKESVNSLSSLPANFNTLSQNTYYIVGLNYNIPLILNKFLYPSGKVIDFNGQSVSDFIPVRNIDTVKLIGPFNWNCPVCFYNQYKECIGYYQRHDVFEFNEVEVDVPNLACYIRCAVRTATNPTLTMSVLTSKEPVSSLPNKAYVSLDGSDENGDGSSALPYRTINYALKLVERKGTVLLKNGDYFDEPIDFTLTEDRLIKGESRYGTRLIYGKKRITSATKVEGYTKVYLATDVTLSAGDYDLWQHDIAAVETLIPANERSPYCGNLTHRLSSTKLEKVSSIQEIDAATGLSYYIDGTDLYFSKADGSDLETNPIVVPIFTKSVGNCNIENASVLYQPFNVSNCKIHLKNVRVAFNNYSNVYISNNGEAYLEDCEFCGSHEDGCGGGVNGIMTERNCWAHDNGDEGSSVHETVKVSRYGGLYEHNMTGITDVGSPLSYLEGVVCRHNSSGGFSFTFYASGANNYGNAQLINCITDGSMGGNNTGTPRKCIKCYNCKGTIVGEDYVEVI